MVRWGVLSRGRRWSSGRHWSPGRRSPRRGPSTARPSPSEIKGTVIGQKTGYFNMAKVMREYQRAKTAVVRLNAKGRMVANLVGLADVHPICRPTAGRRPPRRPEVPPRPGLIGIARQVEDLDREINKLLNNQATVIIAELYDEIHATVGELAREHGLVAVLAYPDAVTARGGRKPGRSRR